ncbi:DUF1805 domain-containing protein [Candidatus Bathyarchaeota archaeon]|nr:MAG: DUF1805 domain-containing protein [Candidatus Bathyarchaeota archaeon]
MPAGSVLVGQVDVDGRKILAVKVELPGSPPLLLLVAEKGFVMCGYLNIEVAERLGVAAAMVSGVRTFEDVLEAPIRALTSKARELGVKEGMKGREALKRFM